MPVEFRKMGIAFQYPENWSLDEEDALAGRKAVTLYSPGGGFWSVSIHPHAADPRELAQIAVTAMQEEYSDLEVEEVEETIAGRQWVGFDLNFFFLDLTNTALVRCLRTEKAIYTVFCQAEDHEFDDVLPIFRAITTSLVQNLKPSRPHSHGF